MLDDPLPEATSEPPERFPGGADAIEDEDKYGDIPDGAVVPDLPPEDNPAVDDEAPDELQEPEPEPEEDAEDADELGTEEESEGSVDTADEPAG